MLKHFSISFPMDSFASCAFACHFAGAWFFTLRTWPHLIFSLKIACSLQRARFRFPQKGNNACINFVNPGGLMIGVIVSISSRWRKFMAGHKQMYKSS